MQKHEGWENWFPYRDKIIYWLNMEAFSEAYGWTPEQIENLDSEAKRAYESILIGKGNKSKK